MRPTIPFALKKAVSLCIRFTANHKRKVLGELIVDEPHEKCFFEKKRGCLGGHFAAGPRGKVFGSWPAVDMPYKNCCEKVSVDLSTGFASDYSDTFMLRLIYADKRTRTLFFAFCLWENQESLQACYHSNSFMTCALGTGSSVSVLPLSRQCFFFMALA